MTRKKKKNKKGQSNDLPVIKSMDAYEKNGIYYPAIPNIEKKVVAAREFIMYKARSYAKHKKCPKCRQKNWKIVPLFEYGDPYMLSSIVLFCNACKKYKEIFAKAPDNQARAYAESLKRQGFKKAPASMADKLIKKGIKK